MSDFGINAVGIDISEFVNAMKKAKLSGKEMMDILGAGSGVIKDTQILLVPHDTYATQLSIKEYFTEGDMVSEVIIGPSTEYAPYIEYGTSNPNYPIQPFVVPSGTGKSQKDALHAMEVALAITLREKGLL